jgi:hypothetical protein
MDGRDYVVPRIKKQLCFRELMQQTCFELNLELAWMICTRLRNHPGTPFHEPTVRYQHKNSRQLKMTMTMEPSSQPRLMTTVNKSTAPAWIQLQKTVSQSLDSSSTRVKIYD